MQDGPALEPSVRSAQAGVWCLFGAQDAAAAACFRCSRYDTRFLSLKFGPSVCVLAWIGLGLVGLWPIGFAPPARLCLINIALRSLHTRRCFVLA
jgi:hypothetical protein